MSENTCDNSDLEGGFEYETISCAFSVRRNSQMVKRAVVGSGHCLHISSIHPTCICDLAQHI